MSALSQFLAQLLSPSTNKLVASRLDWSVKQIVRPSFSASAWGVLSVRPSGRQQVGQSFTKPVCQLHSQTFIRFIHPVFLFYHFQGIALAVVK